MENHVTMISLLRIMQSWPPLLNYYYVYCVIITPGSIITHHCLFQFPKLADVEHPCVGIAEELEDLEFMEHAHSASSLACAYSGWPVKSVTRICFH